jgi:hypothetical protein
VSREDNGKHTAGKYASLDAELAKPVDLAQALHWAVVALDVAADEIEEEVLTAEGFPKAIGADETMAAEDAVMAERMRRMYRVQRESAAQLSEAIDGREAP